MVREKEDPKKEREPCELSNGYERLYLTECGKFFNLY